MSLHFLDAFADPVIAARAIQAVAAAAAAGMAVLIVPLALPRSRPVHALVLPVLQSGFAYLVLGLGSRFVVQHHRSRLQMVVLLGVVAFTELVRYARSRCGEGMPRVATWLTGSMAACLGVLAAKWALEPGALSEAWSHLQAIARNT